MILSPHFSLSEMTKNGTSGDPNEEELNCLIDLCTFILEPVRQHFRMPVVVNSGFRSRAYNKSIGGASTSQHCRGQAADIEIPGVSNVEVWLWIARSLPFDQLIAEKLMQDIPGAGWVHVSYRKPPRREKLSCLSDGTYVKGFAWADRQ